MLSITHTCAATLILMSGLPLWVSIPLAIASHAVLDMLGESTYDNWYPYQWIIHILLYIIFFLFGYGVVLLFTGMISGNLIDIIDKVILNYFYKRPDIIHGSKYYPPVVINLTPSQTQFIDTMMAVILALRAIL